jgi:hypothetical protein
MKRSKQMLVALGICLVILACILIENYLYPSNTRYFVCIPQGGLIDICNTILRCHAYAKQYNRMLIIDTTNTWLQDDIQKYISIHSPYVYKGDPKRIYAKIQDLSIYPSGISLDTMPFPTIEKYTGGVHYKIYNKYVSYNLHSDHEEQIMVYSMCRLGKTGFPDFLKMCSISSRILDVYNSRRSILPNTYIGIHVRNTDYSSNVQEFMIQHEKIWANQPLFVASDNLRTIHTFQKKYGKNVYSFANIPENGEQPLHESKYKKSREECIQYNIDTIVDILLLVSASQYYYSQKESGFSQAILEVREEKDVVHHILNA